jgi:hypothetical protein
MNEFQMNNRNYEAIAWGALFVWWGITELVDVLPAGAGPLGVGLILIGVNLARRQGGLHIPWFSLTVGILALIWGGLELMGAALSLPFELPIFAILLIVLGLILLIPAFSSREARTG